MLTPDINSKDGIPWRAVALSGLVGARGVVVALAGVRAVVAVLRERARLLAAEAAVARRAQTRA